MGAGATRRFSAVRWGVARRIVWAWVFTIPAAAILAAAAALTIEAGPIAVTLAVVAMAAVLLALLVRRGRRKQPGADVVMGSIEDQGTVGESATGDTRNSVRDGGRRVAAGVAAPAKARRDGR
jgi:membrane protein implicated in regulation of membrane protease activity